RRACGVNTIPAVTQTWGRAGTAPTSRRGHGRGSSAEGGCQKNYRINLQTPKGTRRSRPGECVSTASETRRMDANGARCGVRNGPSRSQNDNTLVLGKFRNFSFGEISDRLARDPHRLATDPELQERVVGDLVALVQNGQFAAGEVA